MSVFPGAAHKMCDFLAFLLQNGVGHWAYLRDLGLLQGILV